MTDLRDRFHALDEIGAPDLWREIEGRVTAMPQRSLRALPWALIAAVLLLALAVGSAALIGSGVIKLPVSVDASETPSSSPAATAIGSWTETGSMREARFGHAAVRLPNGQVLVMGGMGEHPGGWETASAELYDPGTGSWRPAGTMTQARLPGLTATLLLDGRVLVTGWGPNADLYDPAKGTWTATGPMIEQQRGDHTATRLLDGRVLVAGGGGGEGLASAELYDPATGTWTATASLANARTGHAAILLPDGTVLVAGGHTVHLGLESSIDSAELYDPVTGTWSLTGSMPALGAHLTATLLLNDVVLVIGQGDGSTWADLYDLATGTWTGAPMAQAYAYHTATLLIDGRVLVVGVAAPESGVGPSAVVFDAVRGVWMPAGGLIEAEAGGGHAATLLLDGRVLVSAGGGQASNGSTQGYPSELFIQSGGN